MKKKILISLLFFIVCIFITGCYFNQENSSDYSEFDFVGRWKRKGTGDTEYLGLSSDGGFAYYCSCGSPVDSYDLCEEYTYNEKTNTLKIKCTTWNENVKIISSDKDTLKLNFDGQIRIFTRDGVDSE